MFQPGREKLSITGEMHTDQLFTGQGDTGLGIYYYGARFRNAPRSGAEWGIRLILTARGYFNGVTVSCLELIVATYTPQQFRAPYTDRMHRAGHRQCS